MRGFASFILLVACWASNASAYSVGFDQVQLYTDSDRPLKASVWYPSQTIFPTERIAENAAFLGTDVVRVGTPQAGKFPLVVISHGYRGNWRNQNWLATKFAQDGYVVASLDHPGTTSFDHSPQAAAQWWQRAGDLSRLLDWLLNESYLLPNIDANNITAIGHSLGGWTVMLLAGAQFDRDQLKQECVLKNNPRVCGLMTELGLNQPQIGEPTGSLKDERIKRVVSLDLGLARSLSRQSLQVLTIQTLILAAGVDIGDLPQAEESGFLAQYLPKNTYEYIVYPDAAHFSFMQLCKPGAIEMIEEEDPGDGIVCQDGNWRTRDELHQVMHRNIIRFIQAS
ncbi:alpha/beta hydrolase family protein [Marinomonas sp. BSi20584]|uniref:alpha/beta hydrolase family protein n=1 Tax=Marinomonas sp. BSi20584 TaxID=1594462 RepID=UPI000C1F926F|nr:CocE/NonD family hydrolase [Marinomonas sp. BSi20584]PJE56498.1 lipoprotein signal peptide [Marinomonas sp. BSi20584]